MISNPLDTLREEIQRDRIATMEAITDGFNRMYDKFDEHARDDEEAFDALRERVTEVEGTVKTIRNGLVGTIGALVTAATAWLVEKF